MPDQSAVEGYLETRRRGYHTTPVPPELRLQQAGWSVRQVWVAERAGQTIRGPSLDYVAGEAYRREDFAVEKRARQAERSRVEHALKALRDHADALEEGWETYKAHRGVPTEKVLKAEGKWSHSKAMKGLGNHQKALQGIHETLEKLKDDPALERHPDARALMEGPRAWAKTPQCPEGMSQALLAFLRPRWTTATAGGSTTYSASRSAA